MNRQIALSSLAVAFLISTSAAFGAPPVLEVSPTEMNFTGYVGGPNPENQILSIWKGGGNGPLKWEVTEDCNWLQVDPNSGKSTGEVDDVNVIVDISGLSAGSYNCALTVTGNNAANSPQIVDVSLSIRPEGIWVIPSSFDVNLIEGTFLTETLTIENNGTGDLDFTIRTRQVGSSGESTERIATMSTAGKGGIFSAPKGHDFTVAANARYKPSELIVRFAAKVDGKQRSLTERNDILSSLGGGSLKRNYKIVPGLSTVKLPPGMTVEKALKRFNKGRGILYAEPNYEIKLLSRIPNDTRFNDLWGMHNTGQTGGVEDADIDAPEAWDIATGSSEIIAAVLDTGIDSSHADLAANIWVNEAEFNGTRGQDDDNNGYVDDVYGWDFADDDDDPSDYHGHGTHCAGTVGAVGNNGEGVAGVCWNVKIMSLKVFPNYGESGFIAGAIAAIEYGVNKGAGVLSNSWGGGGYSQSLKDAIDATGEAGVLFLASAGNDDSNNDEYPHYPSSYNSENIIAVMSTDKNDNKSGFSCYGPTSVDLGAPGSNILSCKDGGGYRYMSGTSMATPHMAGACALLWSMNPLMSSEEVKDILLRTVDTTLPGLCVSEGRLNLYNAILETRAPWLQIVPEEGTIGPGESNDISVTFDAITITPGAYEAEIAIVSNDPCSPTTVPVTMTVNADDLMVSPAEGFDSNGTKGGPFKPECVTYTLTNNGVGPVSWTTFETQDWLEVIPFEGVLGPAETIDVNVCISADADLLEPNIYTEVLTFQNTDSNSIKPRSITLTVKPPDCFTESFGASDNDLDFFSLTFSPDGSVAYYEACREKSREFPVDPNGGTYVPLGDDDFAEVSLSDGTEILFYGQWYDRFYIGSNGYITFGQGDTEYTNTLENHFSIPRISGVFTDLTPPNQQCISYKQLDDRMVVTFEDVPLYGDKDAMNSFQIEIFFVDATVRVTWLGLAATGGIAGLSGGQGLPPKLFVESDLTNYLPCWPWGDFNRNYLVNFADFAVLADRWLDEDCNIPYWCGRTDLDFSGKVDVPDVGIYSGNWLVKNYWWLEPVAHWEFDEGEGTDAYDSVGSYNGTLIGDPDWVTGQIGSYALEFDGDGDYVRTAYEGGPSEYTISLWYNLNEDIDTSIFDGCMFLVSKTGDEEPYVDNWGVDFWKTDGLGFGGEKSRNNYATVFYKPAMFYKDEWHHVAVTGTHTEGRIYFDGELKNTSNDDFATGVWDDSVPLDIARPYLGAADRFFNGKIDDVQVYERALSAEEIEELCRDGMGCRAFNPNPANGAIYVDPNAVLSWSPGKDAVSHDVYLGTDFNDVNDADTSSDEYVGNQDSNYYDPCGLDFVTTYYWRIDEINDSNTCKGDVWNFTTWESEPIPNLVSWWKFDEGSGTTAYDSAGNNDGTLIGDPCWVAGQIGSYALDFDGDGDYVNLDSHIGNIEGLNEGTIAGWFKSSEDRRHFLFTITEGSTNINRVQVGLGPAGSGYDDEGFAFAIKRGGSEKLRMFVRNGEYAYTDGEWHHFAVCTGGGDNRIYIDGVSQSITFDVGNSSTNEFSNINNPTSMKIGVRVRNNTYDSYLDGILDDVRIYDRVLLAEEIQELYQDGIGCRAFNPNPADGAVYVHANVILSWSPGKDAVSHDVYFATDFNDVNDANTSSEEYMGNQDINSYDPCGLDLVTTYYWRIDEVDGSNTYKGDVWSFTTVDDPNLHLISWWKFDEGEGNKAYDSAGDNDAYLLGDPCWVAGQIGSYALEFDGDGDYVDCGNDASLEPGDGSLTIAAWVKAPNQNQATTILAKRQQVSPYEQYSLFIGGDNPWIPPSGKKFQFNYIEANTSNYRGAVTDNEYVDGDWHHVVAIADKDKDQIVFYVDGVQVDSTLVKDSGSWPTINNTDPLYIGYAGVYYFDGKIDDVRIYDRALLAEEIQQLYQGGL